jgi:hypothetical protein
MKDGRIHSDMPAHQDPTYRTAQTNCPPEVSG